MPLVYIHLLLNPPNSTTNPPSTLCRSSKTLVVMSVSCLASYSPMSPPQRRCLHGPWVVLAAGNIQCFLGYFLMWLAVVGFIPRPPVPLMCLFMFLAAHGLTFFSTATVVTGVLNFPDYSGTIVGIMKGFLGLAGAILIQIYQAFFKGNMSNFILMLALLPTSVTFSLMCLVKICPGSGSNDKKHLNHFSIISLILATFLMITIILENVIVFPRWGHLVALIVLLMLLGSTLKIALEAISTEKSETLLVEREPLVDKIYLHEPENFVGEKDEENNELSKTSNDILPAEENIDIIKAMQSLNFWLLFVSMSCGMGSGLATINNLSQIGQSLGYDTVRINTLVSLWSIWNFLGRFGAGYISDVLLLQKGWTRPLMVAITQATMIAGHLIISLGFSGNLYIGTTLIGICYGAQ